MRYIYCHPLFDERKCTHRFSYQLAKIFEKNNLRLERFDYKGTGEAEGDFCDVTMDSLEEDLDKMIAADSVCLIGTRFGATVAFDLCSRSGTSVQRLILIEPIINGQGYIEYLFRKQHLKDIMTGNSSELMDEKNFCNLEGYKTNTKFVGQIRQIQLVQIPEKLKIDTKVYLVQISAAIKMNAEYVQFAENLKKYGIQTSIETFDLPVFWERIPSSDYSILTKKILEWCR